jgi:hypothetical protein
METEEARKQMSPKQESQNGDQETQNGGVDFQ